MVVNDKYTTRCSTYEIKNKGFTLVELLAVLIILVIVLAIAIPGITGLIEGSRRSAFEDDAKLIIKGIDTKVSIDSSYNIFDLSTATMKDAIGVSNENYESIGAHLDGTAISIDIVGKNRWHDLEAHGTLNNLVITAGPSLTYTPEECFDVDSYAFSIIDYHQDNPVCTTNVVIPSTINGKKVSIIDNDAFSSKNIVSVTIPDGVTKIGQNAFSDNLLTSINIPNSVTNIYQEAFSNNQLTSITIPNSVTALGAYAFANNQLSTVNIGSGVKTISEQAFSRNKLTSISIPNNVTYIGWGAFNDNQLPDNQAFIYGRNGDGTINNTSLVSYGGAKRDSIVIQNGVTTVGNYAFNNMKLTSVTIPSSVTSIGTYAFSDNLLTSVIFPSSLASIGNDAFSGNNLSNVTIPSNVTTIGVRAFRKTVSFNKTLASIINQTGRSFDWGNIVNGNTGYNFVTGTVNNPYGNVIVSSN